MHQTLLNTNDVLKTANILYLRIFFMNRPLALLLLVSEATVQ